MYKRRCGETLVILKRILLAIAVSLLIPILKNDGGVFATIDPSGRSITLQIQNQNAPIEIIPAGLSNDIYASTMRTLVVSSSNVSEYKVFARIANGQSGDLVLSGGTSSDPSMAQIGVTPSNATTLSTDTWGFGVPSGTTGLPTNNFSNQYASGTPATSSTYASFGVGQSYTLIRSVSNASGNDSFNLYYGMRVGTDVQSNPGTYSTDVDYYVVANASNVAGGEATISPASGPKEGGTTVTITTSLMANSVPEGISATIGGSHCTSLSSSMSTGVLVITCTTPRHRPELDDVVVSISSLGLSYTITDGYEYIETGDVKITGVSYVSGINVSGTPNPSVDNSGNINFDLTFQGGLDNTDTLQATYQLTVTNSTDDDYSFTAPASNLTLRISPTEVRDISYTLSGIAVGDTIPANSSVTFNIILNADYVSGEHSAEGGIEVEPVNQSTPNIVGAISGSNNGDLSGNNTLTSFQVSVESTFDETKTFTIDTLSSDFEIVNSSGQALGAQIIAANTTGTYTFYMKKASGAAFASETATAGIIISYDNTYTNVGEVKIKVDKDPSYIDNQAPVISGVEAIKNKTVTGEVTVNWTGIDNVGVASYSIYRCVPNTSCNTPIVTGISGTASSHTFTSVAPGTYYYVVVGYDDEGNTATQNEINDATTNPGPASKSADIALNWSYSVTWNIENGNISTSTTTVVAGGSWTGTITKNSSTYNLPNKNGVSITMDGEPYTDFDYSSSTGVITIGVVSGDIYIAATVQTCLIEGTLIAVVDENGNEGVKPIEDITYHDLLKVWNHETGTVGYVHPARIEKESKTTRYQLTTFSDGSELGSIGWHGIFDVQANEFISMDDLDRFYPGLEVYKVENDQLTVVTVSSIEWVEEEVKVYHVISSQYYNLISNNILTTNGYVITSNFYGFDENLKWPEIRNEFISNPDNLYRYEDFADIGIPLKMFNDLRLGEASYLQNYGITLQMFKDYLVSNGVITGMVPYDDE